MICWYLSHRRAANAHAFCSPELYHAECAYKLEKLLLMCDKYKISWAGFYSLKLIITLHGPSKFVLMLYVPVNNFSVTSGLLQSSFVEKVLRQRIWCLSQGRNLYSASGESKELYGIKCTS